MRLWVCVLLGWTLLGLSFTLNYYLFAGHYVAIFKQQPTLPEMLLWELPYWLLWALLTPLVFRLTRRFPLERGRLLRSSLVHLAACLGLALAHRAAYLMIGWMLHVAVYRRLASLAEVYQSNFFFNLPNGFMSYATILLVAYAIEHERRHREEELRISRLETDLAQAQLQTLKMQLQPHFLFNTLNSISALLEEDTESAEEMLARLGDFLRLTLESSGAQEVTLQEELELLRCYLEIERVRFQDRLDVALEVEPETLDARVPNLILQPLVENAIRHGIGTRRGQGQIEIRASRLDGRLRLEVRDNGPGLRPEGRGGRQGLGFALTRARLEGLYRGRHSFDLGDAPGGGLQVTLDIPFLAGAGAA